ncbi:hypothetical protein L3Q67_38180 [Saccharothrix sp. AJ9571]|nr:hypothetical protein L3Q67_38180 [Saccharothrix sp. AJ9571]
MKHRATGPQARLLTWPWNVSPGRLAFAGRNSASRANAVAQRAARTLDRLAPSAATQEHTGSEFFIVDREAPGPDGVEMPFQRSLIEVGAEVKLLERLGQLVVEASC